MKNNLLCLHYFAAALLIFLAFFSSASAQSIAESFESGLPTTSSKTTADYTLSSGTWTVYDGASSSTAKSGSLSLQLSTASNSNPSFAAAPSVSAVSTVSLWARASSKSKLKIQKSVDGGAYTDIATLNLSTTYTQYSVDVNETSSNVRIRFANPSNQTLYVDEVSIGSSTTSPSPDPGGSGAATWYVATSGDDANAGTLTSPFKTIPKAVSVANAGDTIYVRGGNHVYTTTISISKSGTSSSKLHLLAYPNERPVLDFSGMAISSSNRGMNFSASYWEIKGIDFFKAGDNGMYMSGSYNLVEYCSFYENYDTGLQLGGGASHNKIINCDSYYNADPNNGNADGFAPKLDVGTGNYFYGCRAWQNSDDGWDGYMRGNDDVTTTLENCWVFKSGYLKDGSASTGNGNGFKMGGSDDKTLMHNMILINCLAFENRDKGYDQNSNKGSMTLYNSTAYNNGRNYVITTTLNSGKTLKISNCIAAGTGTVSIGSFAIQETNSWMSGFTVTNDDFVSVNSSAAYGPRKADGSLPDITFMHLASGSDLIDRGTNVGLSYNGTAPDLGCFESNYSSTTAGSTESMSTQNAAGTTQGQNEWSERVENLPNPFTAFTTLRFRVAEGGNATLKVVNLLGQEMAVLFNGNTEPGTTYAVEFDASTLPAGMYLGVLENGAKKTVHKMLLSK